MIAHLKYRSARTVGWTRIDMLLALYNALTDTLWDGIGLLHPERNSRITEVRAKACRQLLGLIDGLDLDQGDVPRNILRLLFYIWEQIGQDDPRAWSECLNLVQTLKTGFEGIAEEARMLEQAGKVPKVG